MATIKTAKEILREMEVSFNISDDKEYEYNIVDTTEDHVVNAMIVYAQQFIDLATDNVRIEGFQMINGKRIDFKPDDGVIFQGSKDPYPEMEILINKESILNIKQQIK